MNTAELLTVSTFLTKYFASEPLVMVNDAEDGDSVASLHWTYMLNDVTGHDALAVALDLETDTLVIEEAEGFSFTTEARCLLKGYAQEHGLDCVVSAVYCDGSGPIVNEQDETTEQQTISTSIH